MQPQEIVPVGPGSSGEGKGVITGESSNEYWDRQYNVRMADIYLGGREANLVNSNYHNTYLKYQPSAEEKYFENLKLATPDMPLRSLSGRRAATISEYSETTFRTQVQFPAPQQLYWLPFPSWMSRARSSEGSPR
ncbi:hypothetical protein GXW82_11935 [Streptacidiphilus sp. 4-A2]|nr:hypothetical protein [Streptacidiphilus sp. 4-A2]